MRRATIFTEFYVAVLAIDNDICRTLYGCLSDGEVNNAKVKNE